MAGLQPRGRDGRPGSHPVTSGHAASDRAGRGACVGRPAMVDLVSPPKPDPRSEWMCGHCGLNNPADGHGCGGCGRLRRVAHEFGGEDRCFEASLAPYAAAVPLVSAPGNGEPTARPRLLRLKKRVIQDSDEEEGDAASPMYDVDEEY
jgi:hypothetical protein